MSREPFGRAPRHVEMISIGGADPIDLLAARTRMEMLADDLERLPDDERFKEGQSLQTASDGSAIVMGADHLLYVEHHPRGHHGLTVREALPAEAEPDFSFWCSGLTRVPVLKAIAKRWLAILSAPAIRDAQWWPGHEVGMRAAAVVDAWWILAHADGEPPKPSRVQFAPPGQWAPGFVGDLTNRPAMDAGFARKHLARMPVCVAVTISRDAEGGTVVHIRDMPMAKPYAGGIATSKPGVPTALETMRALAEIGRCQQH